MIVSPQHRNVRVKDELKMISVSCCKLQLRERSERGVYRKRDKTEKFKQKLRSGIEEGGVHKTAKSVSHEKVKSLARGVLQW